MAMRNKRTKGVLVAAVLVAAPLATRAQVARVPLGDGRHMILPAANPASPDGPPAPSKGLRPADAGDPRMQALVEEFFTTVPCNGPRPGVCGRAKEILQSGGDDMVAYLMVQAEASEREGFEPYTYWEMLGYTETEAAFQYLRRNMERQMERAAAAGDDPTARNERGKLLETDVEQAIDALVDTNHPEVERVLLPHLRGRWVRHTAGLLSHYWQRRAPSPEAEAQLVAAQDRFDPESETGRVIAKALLRFGHPPPRNPLGPSAPASR